MTIGEQLRLYRVDQGLTMDDLARKTGLSISYISGIERDSQGGILAIARMAEALHLSPAQFFGFMDEGLTARERLLLSAFRKGDIEAVVRLALEQKDES